MVNIIEAHPDKGDVKKSMPIAEAVEYIKAKKDVYIYHNGEIVEADKLSISMVSEDDEFEITLPLVGGRNNVDVHMNEEDALRDIIDEGGMWFLDTIKNRFAKTHALSFRGADNEELYRRNI